MRFIFTCATDLRHDLDLDLRGADAGEHCTRATADLLLNADRSSGDPQLFSCALKLSAASCPCCCSSTCATCASSALTFVSSIQCVALAAA